MGAHDRTYLRNSAIAAAVYIGVTFGSRLIARGTGIDGALLTLVAALPIFPAIAWTLVYVRRFQTMDELQKRIHVDAFAAAALFNGLVFFSLGILEDVAAPRLSVIWVFPSIIFTWGAIACYLRWRYSR